MNRKIYLLFIFIGGCYIKSSAQNDSINWLEEVILSDVKLTSNSSGQLVKELSDSLIQQNEPFLTSLLKFNSPFYFRENGYGMVSSASVRGTGAAQNAVIWNGININSQFTGQTDFNAINTQVFQNVSVKPGGGSVVYGSGAI
ncbi:MAG: TonB-dependent receptor plug domain-containing protein, partial [Gramella sp.]|nr:TonB-dependent receptor plug domain-containing protein [Christiangramia sp.]